MPTNPKQIVRNYVRALTRGPLEKLREIAAPDIKGYQGGQMVQGHEALLAYANHYRGAYPDWDITFERMVAEGTWVVGQGVSSGQGLAVRFTAWYKVARGRVTEVHIYGAESNLDTAVPLAPRESAHA